MAKKNKRKSKISARLSATKQIVPKPKIIEAGKKDIWIWLKIVGILAVAALLYLQTKDFDFVLDDKLVYSENAYVQDGVKSIGKILTEDSFSGYFKGQRNLVEGARYRPLSLLTFAMENSLWGGGARGAHLLNILFYMLALWLLYEVLWVLLPHFNTRWIAIADIGTLLFALHPIHTEVVANIKGRDEILAFLFSMLLLLLLRKYIVSHNWRYLAGSIASFFLGVLSKEHVLSMALLAPLGMWFFAGISPKKAGKLLGVFLTAAIVYIGWRFWVVGFASSGSLEFESLMNNPFLHMRWDEKWATIVYTLGIYFKLLIFPHPLTHDYYPYHIPIMHWTDPAVLVSALLYFFLLIFALRGLQRKAVYSYAIWFYLGALFIVSNIPFTIGTFMNERFLFLPSFGLVMWAAWEGVKLGYSGMKWQRIVIVFLTVVVLIGYVVKDIQRIPDWKTGFTLNQSAVKVSANSARINLFMGVSYFKKAQAESGEEKKTHLEVADHYFSKATRILPDYFEAWKMKSGVLAEQFRMDGDIHHLLKGFSEIVLHKPGIPYINDYIKYLKKRGNFDQELVRFLDNVGYAHLFKESKSYSFALHYLTMGEDIADSPSYFNHMAEVYQAFANDQQKQTHPKYDPKILLQRSQSYRKKALSLSSN